LFTLLAGCLLTGCAGDEPSTPAADPSPTARSSVAPPGAAACTLLVTAIEEATLMQPGVADTIASASASADQPVAAAGHRLATAYAAAVASHDTDGEPDAVADVSAAGAEMKTACVDAGLETAG
jgi:hypothetical protein